MEAGNGRGEGLFMHSIYPVIAGLVPAIHVFLGPIKTWMPGTRPGMTIGKCRQPVLPPLLPDRLGDRPAGEHTDQVRTVFGATMDVRVHAVGRNGHAFE